MKYKIAPIAHDGEIYYEARQRIFLCFYTTATYKNKPARFKDFSDASAYIVAKLRDKHIKLLRNMMRNKKILWT